jgi:hypothetical protein
MEARESQDLFNKLADILDFVPETFNQGVWGTQMTLERLKDSNGVESNIVQYFEDDSGQASSVEQGGKIEFNLDCGTACCVAGWAAILHGWHPTITEFNNGEYAETYEARLRKQDGDDRYLSNAEHKIYELEYAFVADRPGVRNEQWSWTEAANWENGVMVLEDGVTEVGRVDIIAQKLLCLTHEEATSLFDSTQEWEAGDLRLMGKGEDIMSLISCFPFLSAIKQ